MMLELGLVAGTSYIEVCWNSKYKLYGQDEEGEPVYIGRPEMNVYNIFDVYVEKPLEQDFDKQNWVVLKVPENRYDLAAQYPDSEDDIMNLPSVASTATNRSRDFMDDDTVWLYKGYHRESPSMPNGRMILFCDNDVILKDYKVQNPYVDPRAAMSPNRGLNVFCYRPGIRHGRHFGHTRGFDLLALQENLNIITSTIATNQATYGVQHIAVPRDAGVSSSQIGGTTRLYEYDVDENGKGIPEVLQLLSTPAELFNYARDLVLQMETLAGINSIMRGKVTTSIPPTGVAAALLTAQGQIANSDVEKAYYRTIEGVAMFLLYIISRFQKSEDVVAVAGKNKSREAATFTGDSLQGLKSVKASVGNPLARTLAGKIAIVEVGMNNGMIKTPAQFMEVLQTGNLRQELEGGTAELNLIRWENEKLRQAEVVEKGVNEQGLPQFVVAAGKQDIIVSNTDNPVQHIMEHKVVMDDPNVRNNPRVLNAVSMHIRDHLDQLDTLQENYPQLLAMLFGQPLPMPQPSPGSGLAGAPPPQGGSPMTNEEKVTMENILGPNTAETASEGGDSQAMAAMQAAERKLAQATGEGTD